MFLPLMRHPEGEGRETLCGSITNKLLTDESQNTPSMDLTALGIAF